jgi:DNA topoisomerase-3
MLKKYFVNFERRNWMAGAKTEKLLLIAEKPSLMRDLQNTYNKHRSEIPYDIDFVALSGHVCCYATPKEYPEWDKKWVDLPIPMIPADWKINVISDKNNIIKDIKAKLDKTSYDGLICATDADREGNLIYYLLEAKLKLSKYKAYRLWVHDLTDEAILKSYKSMVDYRRDPFQKNLTYASILRSRFDWLVGMNATVAATLKSNSLMNIGRVKSPTIKLVYDNSMAIDNFVPKTTYGIDCECKEGITGTMFDENGDVSFKTEAEARNVYSILPDNGIVESFEKKIEKTLAPKLFKLSDLQIEANRAFGYSAQKTLELAQSLYETHKLLSYPRCDCRSISTAVANDFDKLLKPLAAISELKSWVATVDSAAKKRVASTKKYVNDEDVNKNSHTALIPTSTVPDISKLSPDELNILKMVYKRFLAIFLPPLEETKTEIIFKIGDKTFKTRGKITNSKGYTEVLEKKSDDVIVPDMKKGDKVSVKEFRTTEHTTTPPDRLTEGKLIAEMENIQKYIEDKGLKAVIKEAGGIGTPATRAGIISAIIKEGYVEKRKSKKAECLYISDKGKQYIENLQGFKVILPELTAEWEEKLKSVEQGSLNSTEFSNQMNKFVQLLIDDIESRVNMKNTAVSATSIGKCPKCGCDIIEGNKGFGCAGYKNNPPCKFVIWKSNRLLETQGKKMTATIAKSLLTNGKCLVKGLKSAKTGKTYDAYVVLLDDGGIEFSFEGLPDKNAKYRNKNNDNKK